jgi:hypothetical protein
VYDAAHREQRRAASRRRSGTQSAIAACLRYDHGLDQEQSVKWAILLCAEHTRCTICGLPNYELARLNKQGPFWNFLGRRAVNRRLHLGHNVAGRNEHGHTPLCNVCNRALGVRTFSPENAAVVLRAVAKKWDRTFTPPAQLWWLNTSIDPVTGNGIGGRLHRSPATERREEKFKVDASASNPAVA